MGNTSSKQPKIQESNANKQKSLKAIDIEMISSYWFRSIVHRKDAFDVLIKIITLYGRSVGFKLSEMTVNNFQCLRVVGKGSFGKVMEVKFNDGKIYAMKVYKKQDLSQIETKNYCKRSIITDIDHPFIVSLRYAFESERKLYLIFDMFNGGCLSEMQQDGYDEKYAVFYGAQICMAIEYLHEKGIVIGDLTLDSIVCDEDGYIKIIDIELKNESIASNKKNETAEIFHIVRNSKFKYLSFITDWWSFGVILYGILHGVKRYSFWDEDLNKQDKNQWYEELSSQNDLSYNVKHLLKKLLILTDESELIKSKEVKYDPFFECIDWDKLIQRESQYKDEILHD